MKFKEEELPIGEQQNLKDSQLSGISQGAPNIGKEKAVAGGAGALDKGEGRRRLGRHADRPAAPPGRRRALLRAHRPDEEVSPTHGSETAST